MPQFFFWRSPSRRQGANQVPAISISGGAVNRSAAPISILSISISIKGTLYAAALGAQVGQGRIEVEGAYRRNTIEGIKTKLKGREYDPGGEFTAYSLMLNSIADFANKTPFTPYFFVGAGAVQIKIDEDLSLGVPLDETKGIFFAYQGGAGIGFSLTEAITFDLEYRYFAALDPEFKSTSGDKIDFDYATHNATLGIRFAF